MKAFDIFVKPTDVAKSSSACGGSLSIIATFICIFLCISQLIDVGHPLEAKEWRVDYHKSSDTLNVHIDIYFPNAPCRILSLDVLDFVGGEMHDINIHHMRLKKDGQPESSTVKDAVHHGKIDRELLKTEVEEFPGCQIYGHFPVRKAPGNFHISFHSYFQYYDWLTTTLGKSIDLEYDIKNMVFKNKNQKEPREIISTYANRFDKSFGSHINSGRTSMSKQEHKKGKFAAEHFLNIYPVFLDDQIHKRSALLHKYTIVKKFKDIDQNERMMPLVEFKLKFLPFLEYIRMYEKPLTKTAMNCLAMTGGIFAIFSLMESVIGSGCAFLFNKLL